jgi:hypothetical protein
VRQVGVVDRSHDAEVWQIRVMVSQSGGDAEARWVEDVVDRSRGGDA